MVKLLEKCYFYEKKVLGDGSNKVLTTIFLQLKGGGRLPSLPSYNH